MTETELTRAMDLSRKNPPPKSKSRSCRPSASPAPAKAKASSSDLVPVLTKFRSAACPKPREQQQVLCIHEKFTTNTYFITCNLAKEKSSRTVSVKKMPKLFSRKCVAEPGSEEDEDDDDDEESDFELEELSGSDEEREVVIRNARKRLKELLTETTSLVDDLEKMENDVQRLQDEKVALLEQLLACEGLTVKPYHAFRPLTRKIKLLRTRL